MLMMCDVTDEAPCSSTSTSSSEDSITSNGFDCHVTPRPPRKYRNSTSSSSAFTLDRTTSASTSSSGSEACLSSAEKAISSGVISGDEEEEEEEEEEDEEETSEPAIEPFISSWSFAMGTQRSMISSVGEKAPKSNVEPMEDWELEHVERAHRESRLAESYVDPAWRFYTHPPTSFCLARVFMRHGLTGDEGNGQWKLPRKLVHRRDSSDSSSTASLSGSFSSGSASSSVLDESTLTKILPTEEFRGGRAVASPSPPAALLSEPLSRMDVLSEKIWDYHNKVAQTDEMLQRKLHLRDMLYTAISPVFPMSGLYVVGSSLNGFGNNSSDMDLCLMITNKDLDQKNDAVVVLNLILSTLQYEKFVASQKLILAKVPILRIKFAAPFDDITVDLNANNSVAIRNTHLLCYYSSYDWRVRPLVSVVKEWAKRKGINDANKSSFTSYSLVLMVIHYLQCGTTPKVLPNLQQTYPTRFSNKVDVRTLNVTMPLEAVLDALDETSPSEKTTLGELLIGFLDYYANQFDYDHDAISIRQGQRVERAALAARPKIHLNSVGSSGGGEKDTPPPSSSASSSSLHNGAGGMAHMMVHPQMSAHFWRSQWRCVCIEEPFTNSNTAHSIYDEMVFGAIKEAFREAHGELRHNHDLDRLLECEPIKASTTNAGAAVFAATYEGERPQAQQPNSIASASLRAMNVLAPANGTGGPLGGGHFHFQQTGVMQQPKQQRPPTNGSAPPPANQPYHHHMNSHRNANHHHQNQQQTQHQSNNSSNGNRRTYGQPNGGGGGGAKASRSNESFKEQQPRHYNRTQNGVGVKDPNAPAQTTHAQTKRKDQESSSKPKRSSAVQSPEPKVIV
ncbi:unnamed protein product [Caenorhabditis sp. 36 PRJEB53466]|nr:unnamed protein product [Caenorhabditis sp. 36 PRJEB53466]